MTGIGMLTTKATIPQGIAEIREWLAHIGVSGMNVDIRYDANQNIALLRFTKGEKQYEFRSTKQENCRLNVHGIARVMEYKVRAHLMGIEDFGSSMQAYEMLTGPASSIVTPMKSASSPQHYLVLGVQPEASNDEIKEAYRKLVKAYHPDMANSTEARQMMEGKMMEINAAMAAIKKERGFA